MSGLRTLTKNRQQPWSTYAVYLTTLTHWALLWDIGLLYYCPKEPWVFGPVVALMVISKWIKFVGHFLRHPVDVLLLPISVVFGYLHGSIKLYAACTLHVVSLPFVLPLMVAPAALPCHLHIFPEFIRSITFF